MSFLIVAIIVFSVVYGYVGWRMLIPLHLASPWAGLAWVGLVLLVLMIPLPIFMRMRGLENTFTDVLSWIGYTGMAFMLFMFVFLLLRDVGWLLVAGGQKLVVWAQSMGSVATDAATDVADPGRRSFLLNLTNAGVATVATALTAYGVYEARREHSVIEVDVPIKKLPPEFDGFRIVQISDVHVSPTVKRDYVQRVVKRVNELNPDLIAFTGDLADGSVSALKDDVAPLADLRATHGAYFVTGNHEYYSGGESWVREVQRLGLDVLMNEHRIIQKSGASILLGGVTDYVGGQFYKSHISNPVGSLQNAPGELVKVLLAHQPRSVFEAEKAGYDLQISGHTHGGQFFPWNFFVVLEQPFVAGLHKLRDTWVYVSRGTGYWGPPVRVGAKSEITVIKLRAGDQSIG